ncbi:S41 family peptidase [Spirosoma fluminis]
MSRPLWAYLGPLCFIASLQAQPPLPSETSLCQPYSKTLWNPSAIQRVADVGKLWGALKYFHPQLMKGTLQADQLLLTTLDPLVENPSKANFVRTIQSMLRVVGDTTTHLETARPIEPPKTASFSQPRRPLPANVGYLALPQEGFRDRFGLDSFQRAASRGPAFLVIDLRNQAENEGLGLLQYTAFVQPLVAGLISHTLTLPTTRSAYYHAYLRQDFTDELDVIPARDRAGDPNYWYQERFGLKNTSQGAYVLAGKPHLRTKRLCFLVNRFDNANTLKALLALRNQNRCQLIFDGPMPDYLLGDYYTVELADGLRVKLKIGERIYEDGTLGTGPDWVVTGPQVTTDDLLALAVQLRKASPVRPKKPVENTAYIRLPQPTYADTLYPPQKLRLLALFNFWNVIHYFCPNKPLLKGPWDQALLYFVPRFLFARDYKSYYWLLRELIAQLNDGHGEVLHRSSILPPAGITDYFAPFCVKYVEGKTIVVKVLDNGGSLGQPTPLRVGDQLLSMDGIPVDSLMQRWHQYAASSNEFSYRQFLHKVPLLSRSGDQPFWVEVRHADGHQQVLRLAPVGKDVYWPGMLAVYYAPPPKPYWRMLNDSTGYVRLNSIYSTQVDSVWQALKSCQYVVLDARGYPRDETIVQAIATPFMSRTDTVCINAFPEVTHPLLSRNAVTLEVETVSPGVRSVAVPTAKTFVLLCSQNASQAETNIMAWQRLLHPVTIGRPTIGANGVSNTILMAGGYSLRYSGYAVYYPDGTPNQGLGVKLDIPVTSSIDGEVAGADEVLQRALRFIEQAR